MWSGFGRSGLGGLLGSTRPPSQPYPRRNKIVYQYRFDPHPDLEHFSRDYQRLRRYLFTHSGQKVYYQKIPDTKFIKDLYFNVDPVGDIAKIVADTIPEIDAALEQALYRLNPAYLDALKHPTKKPTQAQPIIEPKPKPAPPTKTKKRKKKKHYPKIPPTIAEQLFHDHVKKSIEIIYSWLYHIGPYNKVSKTREVNTTVGLLMELTGYSHRSVKYALAYLRRKRYIRLIRRGYPQPTKPEYRSSRYELPVNLNHVKAWRIPKSRRRKIHQD